MEIRANCMAHCPFVQDKLAKLENYQADREENGVNRDDTVIQEMEHNMAYEDMLQDPILDTVKDMHQALSQFKVRAHDVLGNFYDSRITDEQEAIDEALAACSQNGPHVTQKLGECVVTCASDAVVVRVWRPTPKDD